MFSKYAVPSQITSPVEPLTAMGFLIIDRNNLCIAIAINIRFAGFRSINLISHPMNSSRLTIYATVEHHPRPVPVRSINAIKYHHNIGCIASEISPSPLSSVKFHNWSDMIDLQWAPLPSHSIAIQFTSTGSVLYSGVTHLHQSELQCLLNLQHNLVE